MYTWKGIMDILTWRIRQGRHSQLLFGLSSRDASRRLFLVLLTLSALRFRHSRNIFQNKQHVILDNFWVMYCCSLYWGIPHFQITILGWVCINLYKQAALPPWGIVHWVFDASQYFFEILCSSQWCVDQILGLSEVPLQEIWCYQSILVLDCQVCI